MLCAPNKEYSLAILIILPCLRATIDCAAICERKKHEFRFVSITRSQSSALKFNALPMIAIPALLTRIEIGPSLRSTCSIAGRSSSRRVTSSGIAIAGTPALASSSTTARFFSSLRARIATAAPASARPSAIPRPIPPLPPVTTATSPLKSNIFGLAIALLPRTLLDSERSPLLYWRFARVATERRQRCDYRRGQIAMGLRTAEQYKSSLRDGRAVFFRGEKVADVTAHPVIGIAVEHAAIDYRMAHDPKYRELAVVKEDGDEYSRYYHIPQNGDDLLKRSALIAASTREGATLVVLIKEIGTDALL